MADRLEEASMNGHPVCSPKKSPISQEKSSESENFQADYISRSFAGCLRARAGRSKHRTPKYLSELAPLLIPITVWSEMPRNRGWRGALPRSNLHPPIDEVMALGPANGYETRRDRQKRFSCAGAAPSWAAGNRPITGHLGIPTLRPLRSASTRPRRRFKPFH